MRTTLKNGTPFHGGWCLTVLLLCACAGYVSSQNIRIFQGTSTWQYSSGRFLPDVRMQYSWDQQKMSLNYTFSTAASVYEIYDYPNKQQFQQCSGGVCQVTVWDLPMFRYWVNGSEINLGTETKNGISNCLKYFIQQTSTWNTTIWFNPSTGYPVAISAVTSQSGADNYQINFSQATMSSTVSASAFQQSASCGFITCSTPLDLVLLIDDSGSIPDQGWQDSLNFAVSVVNSFPKIGAQDVRIGVITFSNNPMTVINLSSNRTAILEAIESRRNLQSKGETATGDGLNAAQLMLNSTLPFRSVTKAIVLLTDGRPNLPDTSQSSAQTWADASAAAAKKQNTTIFAIGVGSGINQASLVTIASSPSSDYVATVNDFSSLTTIQDKLVKSVCVGVTAQSCQPSCNTTSGFCACGGCICMNNCTTSLECRQPICDTTGTCSTAWIAGCCINNRTLCHDRGNSSCTVSPSSPCSCDAGSCANGTPTYDCSCNCTYYWSQNATGVCTVCNTTRANADLCLGRGNVNGTTCTNCTCNYPWSGSNCSTCLRTNSTCVNGYANATDCTCVCSGFWGRDASGACTVCNATAANPVLCQNRGNVNVTTCASCNCTSPWTGNNCTICSISNCGNGVLNPGNCSCSCTPPFGKLPGAQNCTACNTTVAAQMFCNSHGTSDCINCNCTAPWAGPDCSVCSLTNATCGGPGKGFVNLTSCTCSCLNAWGKDSQGYCTVCNQTLGSTLFCSGRGNVSLSDCTTCNCDPQTPFTGPNCANCTAPCGNGGVRDANCNCTCPPPWKPNPSDLGKCTSCNTTAGTAMYCNNRGNISTTDCLTCSCFALGWTGPNCTVCNLTDSQCYNGTANLSSCNCTCNAWYWNTGSKPCTQCTSTAQNTWCGTRGTIDNTNCTTCMNCNGGWTGSNCSVCTTTDTTCLNGGWVNTTACQCNCLPPWSKPNVWATCSTCNTTVLNTTFCNNRSVTPNITNCSCGTCASPWSGPDCTNCTRNPQCGSQPGRGSLNTTTCTCSCAAPQWRIDSNGTCNTCNTTWLNGTVCGGRGQSFNTTDCATCTGCTWPWSGPYCNTCSLNGAYCVNGNLNVSTCSCSCFNNSLWIQNATGQCSVCQTSNGTAFCNNRGTLNATTCSTCNCTSPWTGSNCQTCSRATCANGVLNSTTCTCSCNLYWGLDSAGNCTVCQQANASAALCGGRGTVNTNDCRTCNCQPCANGGTANSTNCACSCPFPWQLSNGDCTVCLHNRTSLCNNNGSPNATCNGCNCDVEGWTGPYCNICTRPLDYCKNGGTLNGTSCNCTCPTPWSGSDCSTCPSSANFCAHGGTLNPLDCRTCVCPNNFTMATNCTQCGVNATYCTSIGKKFDSASCQCVCDGGFEGTTCQTCIPATCQNYGVWNSSNCACDCPVDYQYTGKTCGQCPNVDCTSNGIPFNYTGVDACTCLCFGSWSGAYCNNCNLNCGNAGTVDLNTCTCQCNGYWGGEVCTRCDLSPSSCLHNSTFNSTSCNCTCPPGSTWSGPTCDNCTLSQATCPANTTYNSTLCQCCECSGVNACCDGCHPLNNLICQNEGSLNKTSCTCKCEDYWNGVSCSSCGLTQANCTHGGVLNSTSCSCNCPAGSTWSGLTCANCTLSQATCPTNTTYNSTVCQCCECSGVNACCDGCHPLNNLVCQNEGSLNRTSCTCKCEDYWNGVSCSSCGLTQANCTHDSVLNSTSCSCNCPSESTWSGLTCATCTLNQTVCPAGTTFVAADCDCCECSQENDCCDGCHPLDNLHCENDGIVNSTLCICQCAGYYTGELCSSCSISQANCTNDATFDSSTCSCICPIGSAWEGLKCDTCGIEEADCPIGMNLDTENCQCCSCSDVSECCDGCQAIDIGLACESPNADNCTLAVCSSDGTCDPYFNPACCGSLTDCSGCVQNNCTWCGSTCVSVEIPQETCTQECTDTESSSSGPGEATGAIVGGVLGGAVLMGAAVAAVAYFVNRPAPPPASAAPAAMGPSSDVKTNPLYEDPALNRANPLYDT